MCLMCCVVMMEARGTNINRLRLLFLVWADVQVNMEDRVEVFRGENAQISCMFVSSEGIGGMIIQWFYVSHQA